MRHKARALCLRSQALHLKRFELLPSGLKGEWECSLPSVYWLRMRVFSSLCLLTENESVLFPLSFDWEWENSAFSVNWLRMGLLCFLCLLTERESVLCSLSIDWEWDYSAFSVNWLRMGLLCFNKYENKYFKIICWSL